MWKVTMRQNLSRLMLSATAIVLGVAFVAGTLLFAGGLTGSLTARVGSLDRGVSVDVSQVAADDALVSRIGSLDGVLAAEALHTVNGVGLAGPDGRKISGSHLAATIPASPALRAYDVVAGRLPDRRGEAVLDASTARERDIDVGAELRIGGGAAATPFRVVGIVEISGSTVDLGTSMVGLVLADTRALSDETDLDRVVVAARPGVTDADLAARVRAVTDGTVRTNAQLLEANLDRALGDVEQLRTGLLAFALVSVLVAAFVIANTFTIVLTQRSRESAMLRMLGASRRQVFTAVLVESTAVGLLASLAGLVLGFGIAAGIGALHGAFAGGPTVAPRVTVLSALVPLLTGTLVTLGAALLPAWRASRVAPVAALSDAALQVGRGAGRGRLIAGASVLAAGLGILALRADLIVVVAGGALTFLGLVMFGPTLVPALIRLCARPAARFSRLSGLAAADAGRNPRRVASTAMALVIGIGLVSAFTVGASSVREGAARAVDVRFGAAFVVSTFGDRLPPELVERLRAEPAVGLVARHYYVFDESLGADVTSAEPTLLARAQPRTAGALAAGSAVVRNLPGGSVTLGGRTFRVGAVLPTTPGRPEVFITEGDFTGLYPGSESDMAELEPAAGVSTDAARTAIDRILVDYPAADLQDHASFKAARSRAIDQALGFVTALLALAVIISLIGVANTLTLSVVERTREHALLRALGLTAGQLRRLLAAEAVLIATAGTILGITMGIGVVASAMTALSASNAGTVTFHLVLPWPQLALILAGATAAALLASILPARRALTVPVVEALSG